MVVQKGEFIEALVRKGGVIPLGNKRVTRSGVAHERYNLWLPEHLNDLWRTLWKRKKKIAVYIEIPGES